MSDCFTLWEIFNKLMQEGAQVSGRLAEQDLWDCAFSQCHNNDSSFFRAQWMPSHLDEKDREARKNEAILKGLVTEGDAMGNVNADALPKKEPIGTTIWMALLRPVTMPRSSVLSFKNAIARLGGLPGARGAAREGCRQT